MDKSKHSLHSAFREKLIEHLLVGSAGGSLRVAQAVLAERRLLD